MHLEIVEKPHAASLLAEDGFLTQWSELYEGCPWATVMQSPDFACAWYAAYQSRVDPILVVSRGDDGRLNGLLALGMSSRAGLVVAGAHQAEYHAWISSPELGDEFAWRAIRAVRQRFPAHPLSFRYLPPNTPLRWLSEHPEMGRRALLTTHERPLMGLGDRSSIDAVLKRKNIRSRLNKLRQMGFAGIERVTDCDRLEAMFDEIIAYHDFRRLSVSGSAPFANDPMKRAFHVELMRRGLLDFTVLRIDGRVVSAQMDVPGRNEVHLALGAYAPWTSKHAPGKIHILEFARLLRDRGTARLDLTPGADSYKAEFATEWDQVHTLSIFPRHLARQKARVLRTLQGIGRQVCTRVNTTPVRAKALANELRRRPVATVARALRHATSRLRSTDELTIFIRPAVPLDPTDGQTTGDVVRVNAVDDLIAYRPAGLDEPRHDFLSAAGRRLADEMKAYTRVEAGRLRLCAWMTDAPQEVLQRDVYETVSLPSKCALIFDVRRFGETDPQVLEAAIREMLADADPQQAGVTTLAAVPRGDGVLAGVVEGLGFTAAAGIVEKTRLGRRSHRARAIATPPKPAREAFLASTVSAAVSVHLSMSAHLSAGEHLLVAI